MSGMRHDTLMLLILGGVIENVDIDRSQVMSATGLRNHWQGEELLLLLDFRLIMAFHKTTSLGSSCKSLHGTSVLGNPFPFSIP